MWIDTHCHLDAAEFDADRPAVRAAARAAGVSRLVLPAVAPGNWQTVRALAEQAARLRRQPGINAVSVQLGKPWASSE